ncbi:MAG: MFS transporter [Deltaproteobacteria bacterium]|nr:MFS transporter [Deltaproteobacteria bacterium]
MISIPHRPLLVQGAVFLLVSAAFTNIYLTQPVLPILAGEFAVDETVASRTISFVVLGIALANLPFGLLADRFRIKPIILVGGALVGVCGILGAITPSLPVLLGLRLTQGLFLPAVTTCLAAYLARSLPLDSLNVVMGTYVSATVAGGLGGRLLGGYIHPPLHWRYAMVSASLFLFAALALAMAVLPGERRNKFERDSSAGFFQLLTRKDLLVTYLAAFGSFFVFTSSFNYLPFYLHGPEFGVSTNVVTSLYLSYLIGIIVGPLAGGLANRLGNGTTMILGSLVFGLGLICTLFHSLAAILAGLIFICAGFFAIHSSAAGSLNRKLTGNRGQANSFYVLFYYLGGYAGITASGQAYLRGGWPLLVELGLTVLLLPLIIGVLESRR